jgi:predicted dehydrogenase
VGFCDVDGGRFRHADAAYPGVPHHADFRAMYAQLGEGFDAAIVSTPDHMHALPALLAMRLKKHVYLQKPLAHSIEEARWLRLEAAKHGVRTQMGNQIHSRSEYRTAVRLIQEGRIGKVTATHSWLTNKGNGYTQRQTRPDAGPVPAGLAWDLWLGVAATRPYAPAVYHPFNWRDWQDFGSGTLGDFGCHLLDPIFTALQLTAPLHVQAESTGVHAETWCEQETVRWAFPATPFTAADGVTLHWYDGGRVPDLAWARMPAGRALPTNGSVIVGEKGTLVLPHVGMPALYPRGNLRGQPEPRRTDPPPAPLGRGRKGRPEGRRPQADGPPQPLPRLGRRRAPRARDHRQLRLRGSADRSRPAGDRRRPLQRAAVGMGRAGAADPEPPRGRRLRP